MPSIHALRFPTTADQVDCGSPTLLDDLQNQTLFMWVYIDPAASGDLRFYQKGYLATVSTYHYMYYVTSTSVLGFAFKRTTSDQVASATTANFPAFALGRWIFLCSALDWTTSAACNFWVGSLALPPSLPTTSYNSQSAGSGSLKSEAAANVIWGQRGGASNPARCAIALAGTFPYAMTTSQVHELYLASRASLLEPGEVPIHQLGPNLIGLWRFGANGQRRVIDETQFGNHGTISGSPIAAFDVGFVTNWRLFDFASLGGPATYNHSVSAAAASALAAANSAILGAGVSAAGATSLAPGGAALMPASTSLSAVATETVTGGLSVLASAAIAAVTGDTRVATLRAAGSVAASATAALAVGAKLTLAQVVALVATGQVTAIGLLSMPASVGLAGAATLTATDLSGGSSYNVSLTVSATSDLAVLARAIMPNSLTIPATVVVTPASSAIMAPAAIPMVGASALSTALQAALAASLATSANATIAAVVRAQLQAIVGAGAAATISPQARATLTALVQLASTAAYSAFTGSLPLTILFAIEALTTAALTDLGYAVGTLGDEAITHPGFDGESTITG